MQQGGSQFGVSPDMPPFTGPGGLPEAASPISSRPPGAPPAGRGSFDELGPVMGNYGEEDALAGEEAERGVSGNRWPRQETLALLKIRSEMDAAFRDATLKGPLWEDVSRKLAELGYSRSAKKCKEKFENVHKYYKRTKDGRAGRQDGKNYRFFSQLEALHNSGTATSVTPISTAPPALGPPAAAAVPNQSLPVPISAGVSGSNSVVGSSSRVQPPPPPASSAPAASTPTQINVLRIGSVLASGPGTGGTASTAAISFSSNTSSSGSDSEEETEEGPTTDTRKRKRSGSAVGGSRKMMAFFEGLMKEVMERQEAMQQRFLEAIEKREQDRMAREEAWKRQEMARLNREHEIMMQERAMAASRDAAVIAFLQKMTGQTIQIAQPVLIPAVATAQHIPAPQPIPQPPASQQQQPPQQPQPQPQQQLQPQPPHQHQSQSTETARHQPSSSEIIIAQPEQQQEMQVSFETTSSSRWPKSEVLALIKLRSGLEIRYQEAGPKGPLWEEISAGMQRLGFNRSSKRCKEKWENINKYFKKVKESNKKRPEDAKTCPYFHQLDALYRSKVLGASGSHPKQEQQEPNQNPQERTEILAIMPPPPPPPLPQQQPEPEPKNGNNNSKSSGDTDAGVGSTQVPTSNGGGLPPSFYEEGPMKKPEDIVKELMDQQQQSVMDDYDKLEEPDSDNLDQDEDDEEDDDEDEEDSKVDYKIEFQRQNVGNSNGGGNATPSSFMAMV